MTVDLEKVVRFQKTDGVAHGQFDISPVFADAEAFAEATERIYQMFEREVFDVVIAVDSTGVVLASAAASRMGKPLVVAGTRKSMILESDRETVQTHHGESSYYMPMVYLKQGQRVVIICDVLTHGKDVRAAADMVARHGGKVIKIGVLLEHSAFDARRKVLRGIPLESWIATSDL